MPQALRISSLSIEAQHMLDLLRVNVDDVKARNAVKWAQYFLVKTTRFCLKLLF